MHCNVFCLIGLFCFALFFETGFEALRPVLELAVVDQAGLELIKIRLPLPPDYWD